MKRSGLAALIFALLLVVVRLHWAPVMSLDHEIADGLNTVVGPRHSLVLLMGGVSRVGSFSVLFWLIALALVVLVMRRLYRQAAFLVVAILGSVILDPALKAAVGRPRPVVEMPVAHGAGNSFPSGHSVNSFVAYTALLLIFLPMLPARWRRPAVVAGAITIVLIGFSRLALGVHFLTDVLGGWSLGVAWVGLCVTAFEERRGAVVARLAAAWVLTYGVVIEFGILLDFLLGSRHGSRPVSWVLPSVVAGAGLAAGVAVLAVIRRREPVVFACTVLLGGVTLWLAAAYPAAEVAVTALSWAVPAVLVLTRTRAWWRWLFVAVAVAAPLTPLLQGAVRPAAVLGGVLLTALWSAATWWLLDPAGQGLSSSRLFRSSSQRRSSSASLRD